MKKKTRTNLISLSRCTSDLTLLKPHANFRELRLDCAQEKWKSLKAREIGVILVQFGHYKYNFTHKARPIAQTRLCPRKVEIPKST
jgi:hypothetical protein